MRRARFARRRLALKRGKRNVLQLVSIILFVGHKKRLAGGPPSNVIVHDIDKGPRSSNSILRKLRTKDLINCRVAVFVKVIKRSTVVAYSTRSELESGVGAAGAIFFFLALALEAAFKVKRGYFSAFSIFFDFSTCCTTLHHSRDFRFGVMSGLRIQIRHF